VFNLFNKKRKKKPVVKKMDEPTVATDSKIWQEFYCHRCTEGGTYIMVKLNVGINHGVEVVCPMCGAKHHRRISGGKIVDDSKRSEVMEQIYPPKSACSKEPRTAKMDNFVRGGVPVEASDAEKIAHQFLRERWIEIHGGG
jgi:hypothetical protein